MPKPNKSIQQTTNTHIPPNTQHTQNFLLLPYASIESDYHHTFRIISLSSTKIIHDVNDYTFLQVCSKEPSMFFYSPWRMLGFDINVLHVLAYNQDDLWQQICPHPQNSRSG